MNYKSKISNSWHYSEIDPDIIRDECLHHLFEHTVDKYPNNIAVMFGKESITYSELDRRSNKLAHYLRRNGVKTGDYVGILLKPSFELYVSILAIMKSGAAYVPIDISAPDDRIAFISKDCNLKKLITCQTIKKNYSKADTDKIILLDKIADKLEDFSEERLIQNEIKVKKTDICYIIYTSGSTGRPKGVLTEHRNACNLVRASQKIYKVVPEDRIYQGFTIAFDASVEELWMAFFNGAALVPATDKMKQAGMGLSKSLSDAGITVFSTVTTMLSMLDEDIPSVRLLIQGGESCTEQVVKKWYKPGRRLINTYGPTEATVIATYSECFPNKPITIGKPLTNYSIYILDENLNETAIGEPGELCIGGMGLARGYLNRDDLTEEKFIKNPFADNSFDSPRLYRTGDLAKYNENGEIEFLGRIDTQVKIRGYRVELSEIESVICASGEVLTSVVSVHTIDGIQSLVAYMVPKTSSEKPNTDKIYKLLKDRLPAYMIPAYYELIDTVPTLPSGKTDRKSLPDPTGHKFKTSNTIVLPNDEYEAEILRVWQEVFKTNRISITDHFFTDLGGHSLLAALAASKLREHDKMSSLAVSDIYIYPTIQKLAAAIKKKNSAEKLPINKDTIKVKPKQAGLFQKVCGLFQGISVYSYFLVISLPYFAIYFYGFYDKGFSKDFAINITVLAFIALLGYLPVTMLLSFIVKWAVIGRYKEGDYPVWGSYFFRWWLVRLFQSLVPLQFITGTPIMSFYCRLMGAKIGKDCFIGTTRLGIFDFITIGDNSSVGFESQLLCYVIEDGYLKLRKIEVGKECYIGPNTVLSNSTRMMDGSQLGEQSMLSEKSVIPSNERWLGSPARKSENKDENLDKMYKTAENASSKRRFFFGVACLLSQIPLRIIQGAALLPGGLLMLFAYDNIGMWGLLTAPVMGISFNLFLCLEIALIKKLLIGKIEPGNYKLYTTFYFRKWFVDQLMLVSLDNLHCLYGTLYTPHFFRLLGCKIGKKVEVSTVTHISPDLLTIKDESFVADAGLIGTPKVYMGQISISKTEIGKRTFIGNSSLIPINTVIGDNCLLGVLSVPPDEKVTPDGTSWLGSPAIYLPRRDINTSFSAKETYEPTKSLYAKRYTIEFIKSILPMTIEATAFILAIFAIDILSDYVSNLATIFLCPLILIGIQFLNTLFVVVLKKLLIGTYKPRIEPLWSTFVWRSELVTGIYESVVVPNFLNLLTGTPYVRFILRMFGVKIGKKTFMDTTDITEFDLVEIADEACINYCTLQTHLFEDRVMKMSKIKVKKNCNIGIGSFILYDTVLNEGVSLGNQSLLMKGESLLQDTKWEGIPVKRKMTS